MTVGDLFSGIGGFSLAATRVFGPDSVRFQVEIDPWCQRVLAKHWPTVKRFADIREVRGEDLEPVDLAAIGFPCQDVSHCNPGGSGIEGARSGLWREAVRVLGALRPRYIVVENVPNLLNRGIGTVLRDLAAHRYDAEWDCLPASAFGAFHERNRLWLVAYRQGEYRTARGLLEAGGEWATSLQSRRLYSVAVAAGGRETGARLGGEPDVPRLVSGLSGRVDRSRGIGNSIYPAVAEFLFRRIQEIESKQIVGRQGRGTE